MERLDRPWLKTDAARERELFRYFEPPTATPTKATQYDLSIGNDDPLTASAPSSPETTLTALAQLCALRLNASRAMVRSVAVQMSSEVHAESKYRSKTVELPGNPKAYPCFTVTDLSQDERFNKLPFVTGPPNFRFYAGTPLTTRNGINIGSLFILDDRVRSRLSPAQEKFLGTMAATVMGHLEVNREAEERRKVLRMAKGLNAFVEGKSSFDSGDQLEETSSTAPLDGPPDDTEDTCESIESAHKGTFSRAAHLLNDSLNLRNHGGVCFLDTIIGPQNVAVRETGRRVLETESESDAKEPPRRDRREQERDMSDQFPHLRKEAQLQTFSHHQPSGSFKVFSSTIHVAKYGSLMELRDRRLMMKRSLPMLQNPENGGGGGFLESKLKKTPYRNAFPMASQQHYLDKEWLTFSQFMNSSLSLYGMLVPQGGSADASVGGTL
ncbi:MAG: hypothetical protein LQ343_000953 [Gyalolechia ehrenbergii]|nr:MAG: hypothetical protein LQ343_000953 [Gyalolechia ehrenbergii]